MPKATLTAKLKLILTPEQKAALDLTTLAYRDGLNHASNTAFQNGKITNQTKLHKLVYPTLRKRHGLPSQMACSVSKTVTASYKTLWTKFRQNKAQKDAGRKVRPYKGLDKAPRFVSRTLTYVYGKDMTLKPGQRVSIGTLNGRVIAPYEGYKKHLAWIKAGAKVGESKLYYQKSKKQYYLLVSMEIDLGDTTPNQYTQTVGVDVGQRYLLTAGNTSNASLFVSGKQFRQKKDQFARRRRELRQKGTRSAKRRLMSRSGRERRFTADVNHKISYQLLKRFPQAFIGIEDLTHIRERTERRSSPKASRKQKRSNQRRSQWSFAELQAMLSYKAPLSGSVVVKVDAEYTSQQCLGCGHRSRSNRPSGGLLFCCGKCGYRLHSDLAGARNVCMRAMLVQQGWTDTGRLSIVPDVSDVEAKAERLRRYSELRWSSDASPNCVVSAAKGH